MSTCASPVTLLVGDVVTRVVNKRVQDARKPYTDGAVSVSELMSCGLKTRFRKEHPGIHVPESIETADEFGFECEVYNALIELFGDKIILRKHVFPYESSQGMRIEGHCDIAITGRKKLVIIQCSSMSVSPHTIPADAMADEFVICDQGLLKRISFDDSLIEQAMIQRFIAQRAMPDLEVDHYILQKTALKFPGGMRKVFLLRRTEETIRQDELEDLVGRHLQETGPKQVSECVHCPFRVKGVCEGQEIAAAESTRKALEGLKPEVQKALEWYIGLYREMIALEDYLKPALKEGFLKGDFIEVSIDGRKVRIGWVNSPSYRWDIPKIHKLLGNDLFQYVQVSYRGLTGLEAKVSSMADLSSVRETARELKWKGLV
ncbi:MAG TPA: hypothetical protein PKV86_00415 [Syntrophobacteraceae bacterium]|nr:hypothetical protein [Syntrophobacteraceae bacterium]